MSHAIWYDKQFIRIGDEYMPMVLGGDSNSWEPALGRRGQRRVRNVFHPHHQEPKKPYLYTASELLKFPKQQRKRLQEGNEAIRNYEGWEPYSDKKFGHFAAFALRSKRCEQTSYQNYLSVYETGIQRALTLEQMGSSVSFYTHRYESAHHFTRTVYTTAMLRHVIAEAEEFERKHSVIVYARLNIDERQMLMFRKRYFPVIQSSKPQSANPYMIEIEGHGMLTKAWLNKVSYVKEGRGKTYPSASVCQKQIDALKKRYPHLTFNMVDIRKQEREAA